MDTVRDVITKIINHSSPQGVHRRGILIVNGYHLRGAKKPRVQPRIIDYGVKPGSTVIYRRFVLKRT